MLFRPSSRVVVGPALAAVAALASVACNSERHERAVAATTAGNVTPDRWRQADAEPGQWMGLGRTYKGERFSPLTSISDTNASRLGFAWEYSARTRRGRVEHGQEATPIVLDGVLYASGPWGTVYAVDAKTGAEKWRYD